MSLKKRKPSVAFSWHKSFAILAPWRKGKVDALENEVVLTKMKLLDNFHENLLNIEDSFSTVSMSVSEQDVSTPLQAEEVISVHSAPPESTMDKSNNDYLSAIILDSKLPILYKFESEDSGVEMPSGANSPSTPTGSEQSFVVHSRESSCDSGTLNPPIPSSSPIPLLQQSMGSLETEQTSCMYEEDHMTALEDTVIRSEDQTDSVLLEAAEDSERLEDVTLGNVSEIHEDGLVCIVEERTETEADEDTGSRRHSIEACDGNAGVELQQRSLRKSTTSDSLDEYMEECCRLSEVNQAQPNPLGSGLGYLEHICQLIEKIGQLQEHNLKLQKQICNLQKDSKMRKTKEDFFVQHCHCGAAGLAFQDLKRHSRSDYHSLAASSGTLSDLSTIPEGIRIPHRPAFRDGDGFCQSTVPIWRRGLNRRSYTEGESRYLVDSAEVLSNPPRRVESYTWGRVKDLVKKTRFRNQSRLGLCSSSLKRSCPQLYRPELGPMELPRRDRNSMIVLGHQKLDYHWLH